MGSAYSVKSTVYMPVQPCTPVVPLTLTVANHNHGGHANTFYASPLFESSVSFDPGTLLCWPPLIVLDLSATLAVKASFAAFDIMTRLAFNRHCLACFCSNISSYGLRSVLFPVALYFSVWMIIRPATLRARIRAFLKAHHSCTLRLSLYILLLILAGTFGSLTLLIRFLFHS